MLARLLRRRLVGGGNGAQPALSVHAALAVMEALAERLGREAHGEAADVDDDVPTELGGIVAAVLEDVTLATLSGGPPPLMLTEP